MHYSWPDCIQRLLEEIDNLTHIHWCQILTYDRNWRYQGEALGYCCVRMPLCTCVCVFIWLLLWDSTVHIHIVASVCFICAHVSNTLHFASFIVQNHHCVHKCKSGSYTHTAHGLFWKTCSCGSEHHASSPITHNQVCHTRVKYIKILRNSREKTKDKKLPEPSEADGLSQYHRTAVSVFPFLCLHLIQEGKSQGKKVCVSTQTQETRLPIP